jgi:hypothetical protein
MLDQVLQHRKAIEARHLHIEKDHIRLVLFDQIDGLNAVGALGQHFDVFRGIQQIFQFFASQLLVVHDQP